MANIQATEKRLPFKKYQVELSIGYAGAKRTGEIDPGDDYTQEEWDEYSPKFQREYLDERTRAWAQDYIEYYWLD